MCDCTCVADANDVYTWGAGAWGQLGLEAEANTPLPTFVPVFLGKGIKVVSCGAEHTAAISGTNLLPWGT